MTNPNVDTKFNGKGDAVFESIRTLLTDNSIEFKSLTHEETLTSTDSAKARGEDLSTGGKALVMKINNDYCVFVLRASLKLSSKKVRDQLKTKKCRFLTSDELFNHCELVSGSVPPFGEPILPLKLYLDNSIIDGNQILAFNAGLLTKSIILKTEDYLRVATPELIFDFAEE
jgi:Ala-tRNA(Pro) deacylase